MAVLDLSVRELEMACAMNGTPPHGTSLFQVKGCRRRHAVSGFKVVMVNDCHAHTCAIRFTIA